jgi:hypothetical protein
MFPITFRWSFVEPLKSSGLPSWIHGTPWRECGEL